VILGLVRIGRYWDKIGQDRIEIPKTLITGTKTGSKKEEE
jgi:hypothetical protein